MAMASKNYILNRRNIGVADLSSLTIEQCEWTLDEAEKNGLYKINASHQIGIATATEVGLSLDRVPIRVVIDRKTKGKVSLDVDTCVSYWRVCNAAGAYVAFQRKPIESDTCVRSLYKHVPNLDDMLWNAWEAIRGNAPVHTLDEILNARVNILYEVLLVTNPTAEQAASVGQLVEEIVTSCVASNRIPYFRITQTLYMKGAPHGYNTPAFNGMTADRVAATEAGLTIAVNFARFRERHPSCSDGVALLCAYAVAGMFRFGFQESYEHREYATVVMDPVGGSKTRYAVAEVLAPDGYEPPAGVTIGSEIDVAAMRYSPRMKELGNLLVWTSGLMHYLYNHTTGGTQITGPLLSELAMYKYFSRETGADQAEAITSMVYEALHPSNKRAIANIFFPTSRVYTHGRARGSPRYERFSLDSFAEIRKTPYPAGSHKAYLCSMALRRVLQSGLAPFLPWADSLSTCINMCKDILKNGARSHIGSAYYTGDPPITQSSALDQFLPDLAAYIQTFNKTDSLAMSPHLSPEVAARASLNWANLMKELKSKDISASSAEVVKEFLSTSGAAQFGLDPDNKETWAGAAGAARVALQALDTVFD